MHRPLEPPSKPSFLLFAVLVEVTQARGKDQAETPYLGCIVLLRPFK
jgi:hypothetical protein